MRYPKRILFALSLVAGLLIAESNCSGHDNGRAFIVGRQPVAVQPLQVRLFGRVSRNREAVRANRSAAFVQPVGAFRAVPVVERLVVPQRVFVQPTRSQFVAPSNGGRIIIINR